MPMTWIRENPPRWDDDKERVFGSAPDGALQVGEPEGGGPLPGEWWRVERDGVVVGYGGMDIVWGDGQVLLVVDAAAQGGGVGDFILDRLDEEAAKRGLNRIYNTILPSHPQHAAVARWLGNRGFEPDDDDTLHRPVRRRQA